MDLTIEDLKEQGNKYVKDNKYGDALESYTKAISISAQTGTVQPSDQTLAILYSNRSFVHLKLKQFYLGLEDADKTITLNPSWAKGFFRKAEIYFQCGHYTTALIWYGAALQIDPSDKHLISSAQKAALFNKQQNEYERRLPYVGSGIGIIIGVIITLCDKLFTKKSSIENPIFMVLFVFLIAIIGFIFAKFIRYYQRQNKKDLLEPPEDYENVLKQSAENESDENNQMHSNRPRYSKTQARMRYKKGKL